MDADLAAALQHIIEQNDHILVSLAAVPPHAVLVVPPAGEVGVNPTGPRGLGTTRFWPEPHPEQGEMLLGYAGRCMKFIDPTTGKPVYPAARYGPILLGAPAGANFAEQLDKILYPYDWMTEAELEQDAKLKARDANAKWVSDSPATPPVSGDTPIPSE